MQKKLTITLDEKVYEGLHKVIGPGRIGRFIEDLVRPHVISADILAAYKEMAEEEEREESAFSAAESMIGDFSHEPR